MKIEELQFVVHRHQWTTETLQEPNFGIIIGAKRTCAECGEVQYCNYSEGRNGGPWRAVKQIANDPPRRARV